MNLLYSTCLIFHYLKQQYLHLCPYLNQTEIIYLSGKGVQTGWDRIKVSCADSLQGKKIDLALPKQSLNNPLRQKVT